MSFQNISSSPVDAPVAAAFTRESKKQQGSGARKGSVSIAAFALRFLTGFGFLAVFIAFSLTAPFFFSLGNLGNILGQSAILGVLTLGMTMVTIGGGQDVINGGIDLSLAANMGLSAATYASLLQAGNGDAIAIAASLGVGLAIGLVNAIVVTKLKILPLLATLAVMNIVAGLELVLTQNTVIAADSAFISALSGSGAFGIPVMGYVLLAFALLVGLGIHATPLGPRLYAAGEFAEAAIASGIRLPFYLGGSFVFSGFCGGLAGILSVAYLSGSTTGAGDMLLPIVVAALLGTVFSRRLVPTIGGALISTLFIGILINGFQLLNLSSTLVNGVQGLLILLVVACTTRIRRKSA